MIGSTMEEVYGPEQVAEMLGVDESDLEEWRRLGCGPKHSNANGVVQYTALGLAEFTAMCSGYCFGAGSVSAH